MHIALYQCYLFYERDGIILDIREYLIGVTAAAIFCAAVRLILPEKGFVASASKLLLGLLMTLTVVRPWVSISMEDMFQWPSSLSNEGQQIVAQAEKTTTDALRESIKKQVKSYISEKALSMGTEVEADVSLSDSDLPVPVAAVITGAVSPYAKQMITQILTQELGITKEAIEWIG